MKFYNMRIRRVIIFSSIAIVALSLTLYGVAQTAVGAMTERIVELNDVPTVDVVIVPGASVLPSGKPSDVLADRLLTAVDIYNAGKASTIFVSGDGATDDYNEPAAMRAYLVAAGVTDDDIVTDNAGLDTFATMQNAHDEFGDVSAAVATQTFHLPRALYIGKQVGMDVYGVAAERQPYIKDDLFAARERFANVKAFIDVHVRLW